MNYPPEFLKFLSDNEIDPSFYQTEIPKFFFITDSSLTKQDISEDIPGATECAVVPRCFSVPSFFQFRNSRLYLEGKLIPIDAASIMGAFALDLQKDDDVLDLCCAPGAKLVVLSCLLCELQGDGSVTGVDLSKTRLEVCRALVTKYRLSRIRLFLEDGCRFNVPPHTILPHSRASPFAYTKLSKPFHSTSEYRKRPGIVEDMRLYDKVLVDAPCTHDGSIKHVQELFKCNWKSFDCHSLAPESLSELYELQYRLLEQAFTLVKPGGLIVYSTCSLSRFQNEAIVGRLLDRYKDQITPKPLPEYISSTGSPSAIIHPLTHGCGALFIALLIKR